MITLNDSTWEGKYLRAGGSRPIYYVKIFKSEGTINPDGGPGAWPGTGLAQTERWFSTGPVDWTDAASRIAEGTLHLDRMNGESISEVVFKVNAVKDPGGVAAVSGFRFLLDNSNGFYKQLEDTGVYFEGRRIELFLSYGGETTRDNDIQLFAGFLSDQPLKKNTIEFRAEGRESRRDTEMPPNIFEEETNAWETLIPQRTIGKAVPLVFGSHDMAAGRLVTEVKDDGSSDRGRAYRFVDSSIGLAIAAVSKFRFGDEGLVDASGGFASIKTAGVNSLPDTTQFAVDTVLGEAYFDEASPEKLFLYADIRPKAAVHHEYLRDALNPENALDGDEASFSHLEYTNYVGTRYGTYKIPSMSLSGEIEKNGMDLGIFCLMRIRWNMPSNSEGWGQVFIGEIGTSGGSNLANDKPGRNVAYEAIGTWDWYSPLDPDSDVQLQMTGETWSDWSTLTNLGRFFFHHALYKGNTNPTHYTLEYDLYEFLIRVYFSLDFPDDGFFANVDGYQDDGSGRYTGSANSLVENPAHLVALILDKFGESVDVDLGSHLAVASYDRAGWKLSRNIVDRDGMDHYLKELCASSLLFSWTDESGQAKVFPMSTPTNQAGVDFILRATDVSHGILDQPSRTPLSEVITDFVVQYKYNPVRDEFDGQLICNGSESSPELGSEFQSICAWAKYNNGGMEKKKTIELDWIRDRATAVEVAKMLVRWYSTRRWSLTWTSDLALVQVQVGDSFIVDPAWLTDQPDSLTSATYRISSKRLAPKTNTIRFGAVQVFE